jgi:hypothetical protein
MKGNLLIDGRKGLMVVMVETDPKSESPPIIRIAPPRVIVVIGIGLVIVNGPKVNLLARYIWI